MLQVVFRDESALISPSNDSASYVIECKLRGLLPDEDALVEFAEQYSTDNLQQTTQALFRFPLSTLRTANLHKFCMIHAAVPMHTTVLSCCPRHTAWSA
jgi:hypothetical protein